MRGKVAKSLRRFASGTNNDSSLIPVQYEERVTKKYTARSHPGALPKVLQKTKRVLKPNTARDNYKVLKKLWKRMDPSPRLLLRNETTPSE